MAIYHLTAKIIGRKAGQSAVACAAYRSGQELDDARSGQTFRFSRADRVVHSEIALPDHAPAWARDRAALWNAVEAGERRKDAQLAREFELALPVEFDLEQQRELLRTWVSAEFTSAGAAADLAIHLDKAGRNPHAHIMTTMRALGPEGWSKQKLRQWEDRSALEGWRESWASHINQALERAGRAERVDHRSYADQDAQQPENLRREPTRKVGPWAKGGERETQNRVIAHRNRERLDKLAALAKRLTVGIARRLTSGPVPQVERRPSGLYISANVPRPGGLSASPAFDKQPVKKAPQGRTVDDLTPGELTKLYLHLYEKEIGIQAKAAGIPVERFKELPLADRLELSGGAGLDPLEFRKLNAIEARLEKILPPPAPAAQPAPSGPSPADLAAEDARKKKKQEQEEAAAAAAWNKRRGTGR